LRAQVAGARDRVTDALTELRAIPDSHPLGPLARLAEGQFEARRGRLRAAEAAFLNTLARQPTCAQARRELVYIYSVQHRLGPLDEQLAALADLGALDREHLLHWGRVRHINWSPQSDLPALERYVAADPDDRPSRLALAEALMRVGRLDEAEFTLAHLPAADPDARVLRFRLAEARNDPMAADALLDGGPADHPGLAYLRGLRALARHDNTAAVCHLRSALASQPHDRATLSALAQALVVTGDAEAARPLMDEVRLFGKVGALIAQADAEKGRDDPALARRLGVAIAALGRPAEARAWLRRAIADDPLDAEAQQALQRLDAEQPAQPTSAAPASHGD
jgi:predicted Zn-dependent protease